MSRHDGQQAVTASIGQKQPYPLDATPLSDWRALAARAVEPNAYHLPGWLGAVDAFARDRTGINAISAWDRPDNTQPRLSGLLPVISAWRAYRLPLPVSVSADPYGTLSSPLLDAASPVASAAELLAQARAQGDRAIILREAALDGPAMQALNAALAQQQLQPIILNEHHRACLDATREPDALLRDALGAKKLKELRRQRNRLGDDGEVRFVVSRTSDDIAVALETFLTLEASGWKARRGTALAQHAGDLAFIRQATEDLSRSGQCQVVTLFSGDRPVASGVVIRHQRRAFYFKMGVDETHARLSPGVQLTLDLTRHLCADPDIDGADSSAAPGHPMIDPIWRDRLRIGDVILPLHKRDAVVAMTVAALRSRQKIRAPLRQLVHYIRNRQG